MVSTGINKIAEKARSKRKLCFTSLAHHITEPLLASCLSEIKSNSAAGIDGEDVQTAKENFSAWSGTMLAQIHRQSYRPPASKRVYIPKAGKDAKRPIAIPTVQDKVLQRAVAAVLNGIYEQDFLNVSFGGRVNRSAHQALATVNEGIMGKRTNFVYEADLKNFFGSLSHEWLERFLKLRVGDPRILTLIRRWFKVGVMEDGQHQQMDSGVPQGGPISVLISNIYLHYVLDLWIEKIVKPRMKGMIFYVRYLDDFVVGFEYKRDALTFQRVIEKRLAKFALALEPSKTRLVAFGRFAAKYYKAGVKPETIYFLGFTLFCTKTRDGRFKIGLQTECSRFKRSCAKITERLKKIRHLPIRLQVRQINQVLRGHYQYYGITGNSYKIKGFHHHVVRTWRKWLSSRSQKGKLIWVKYKKMLKQFPLQAPKIAVSYPRFRNLAIL